MKQSKLIVFIVLFLLVTGCQTVSPGPVVTENNPLDPTAVTSSDPTAVSPTTAPPSAEPPTPTTGTATAVPLPASPTSDGPADEAASLPPSGLFPLSWSDRDTFRAGLIPEQQNVLEQMPGATMYHMKIDITDPKLVRGRVEALYTNQEDAALDSLVLHLFPPALGGDMTVENVQVNGLDASSEVRSGKLWIDLEEPLQPGEEAVVSMDFETAVPGDESTKYRVLAFEEGVLALAHFYPMFAVYDGQGWHTEPTAPHGDETYADTSYYLVEVTAPLEQVVVAGGVVVDRAEQDGNQIVTFAAGPMRDFYLAASDDYAEVQRQVGPVTLRSYAPANLTEGAEMALDVSAQALQSFGERFGPYPYSELDIVGTHTQALGIEYPGIFVNTLRMYDLAGRSSGGVPNGVLLESTSAHEMAHQWFYGLVGNDQLNEPWLDESLTQYATWTYFADRYGAQGAQGFYNSLQDRYARAADANLPIGLPADAYSGQDYGAIVYGRGPLFLDELADRMGQETFDAFLRDYSDVYRWQIADGPSFKQLAEQHCACDLSDLFDEQVFGN